MNTCETCRFWEEPGWRRSLDPADDPMLNCHDSDVLPGKTWGVCVRERHPASPMYTLDASLYASSLRTIAEFGCTAHEPGGSTT